MKNSFNNIKNTCSEFGNTARDNIMQFQIDNETGYKLTVVEDSGEITITLLSKTNKSLGGGSFSIVSSESLKTVSLDSDNKRIDFELTSGTHLYCDISSLYTLIDTKQDILNAYIKSASVDNLTLTLTDKDDNAITFKPTDNNYTNDEKTKLENIEENAQVNVETDWNAVVGDALLENKESIGDGTSILYDSDNNHLKLPDDWIEYLKNQTFKIPTISLTASATTRNVEYGTTVTSTFSHSETNTDNINGTLTLYRNGASVETNIAKSSSSSSLDTQLNEKITSTISYQLKCNDTLGNERTSNTISFTCYKPVFYGCNANSTIENVDGLSKNNSSTFGTITFESEANQYAYFVTSGTITSIKSSGFDVPFIKQDGTISVTFNEEVLQYNVYRTASSLDAGSNTMTIA